MILNYTKGQMTNMAYYLTPPMDILFEQKHVLTKNIKM